ncbi:MAG: sensor histidine kinase, partial [Cyanobacteria bacterium J06607_6]
FPAACWQPATDFDLLRESDRLQELLGYFDETLQAADDTRAAAATSAPLLLAPADESPEEPALLTAADSLAHFGGALDIHPGSVAALIEPLVRLNQPLAEAAEMKLHLVPPAEDVWLQFDPKALGEILNNLLDNALKYSSPETEVWLQWGLSHPDQPTLGGILLGDTGPGIPFLDQEHIFERHYRGRQAAGELDGSGLGLAIAADLMGEMRGQIAVYSPLSKLPWTLPETLSLLAATIGTAFVLWLPIATAEA